MEQGIRATEKNSDHSISKPANKGQLINNRVSESVSISPGHGKANDAKNLTSGESETSVGDGKPSVVRRKKSVSFAEGTKVADATGSSQRNSKKRDQSRFHSLIELKQIWKLFGLHEFRSCKCIDGTDERIRSQ